MPVARQTVRVSSSGTMPKKWKRDLDDSSQELLGTTVTMECLFFCLLSI